MPDTDSFCTLEYSTPEMGVKNKVKDKASKYVKKGLGPCSNVTGGWGKTKCLALLDMVPIRYACVGLLTNQGFDGVVDINIKSPDQILFDFDGLVSGKVKGQDNNLLGKGTFKSFIRFLLIVGI